jgi:Holliday junction resolvase
LPRTNYEKGRDYEYAIIRKLKKAGYDIAQRSAGSHSPIDIWALDTKNRKIKLIQAKSGKSKKRELSKLNLDSFNGYWLVQAEAL